MLKLEQINFTYPNTEIPALKNISAEIMEGEFTIILGANGSGKSTLCRILAGLLKPQTGNITAVNKNNSRPLTGLLLANPQEQIICPLVEEEVAFGMQNIGIPQPLMIERIGAVLADLKISHLRHEATHTLSGGEQQQVLIASLLALEPEFLILDEAASFLDPAGQKLLLSTIKRLNSGGNMGIVWCAPSAEELLSADRILALDRGEITFDGNRLEFLLWEDNKWLPELYALANKLRDGGFSLPPVITPSSVADVFTGNNFESVKFDKKSSENKEKILSIKDLSYKVKIKNNEKIILDKINCEIQNGEFWGISGQTGSGKSTLLQILSGILTPSGGDVINHKQHKIGIAFQFPERQFFLSTIEEEAAFSSSQSAKKIEEIFSGLGLDYQKIKGRSPHELSGGEKRKLAMACVLLTTPDILILDEPTVGLDNESKIEILNMIQNLHRDFGLTTIMASHDLNQLYGISDQLLILKKGLVHWSGRPEKLLENPDILTDSGYPVPPLWEFVYHIKRRIKNFNPCNLTPECVYTEIRRYFSP